MTNLTNIFLGKFLVDDADVFEILGVENICDSAGDATTHFILYDLNKHQFDVRPFEQLANGYVTIWPELNRATEHARTQSASESEAA